MAKIITIMNEKGGIGKSSIIFSTAWELAKKDRVLLIDLDGQKANLTYFCNINKDELERSAFDVIVRNFSINKVKVNIKKNLDIIPADSSVSMVSENGISLRKFKHLLDEVENEYDYIFIDVNPSPNWAHAVTLSVVDYAIILMNPEITSIESDKGMIESISDVISNSNPDLVILGILFNNYENRTIVSQSVENITNTLANKINTTVFDTKIRRAVQWRENVSEHVGVTEYAPKSNASKDLKAFVKEMKVRMG